MILRRGIFFSVSLLLLSSLISAFKEVDEETEEKLPFFFGNRPRIISIFSKPPKEEAPKQSGPGILGHVGNVIHGGSIGIEFRPLAGVQGIIEHAKKIIPGGKPEVGQPEHQKPPYEPPKGGSWEKDPHDKDWISEKPVPEKNWKPHPEKPVSEDDWIPEDPEKPEPEGPSWEDIGEDPEDEPSIPYEEIINPRAKPRPKRHYLNSRIYHVPVKFVSNAKPFQMRFNSIGKTRSTEKSVNNILRK